MNQRDIDLVQELEAKQASRAEATRMEENARLNALKAAKAAERAKMDAVRARARATVKYGPRKKREPS
jgi:hypothetical protein